MGKKKTKKKNYQNNRNNTINNNITNNDNNKDENSDNDIFSSEIKIELKSILDIINSNNSSEIYKLTNFLSNYNYDILCQDEDKRDKEIFTLTSINFLIPYLTLYFNKNLNDLNKKIKYNIISSIINIFSNFSENSKYEINFKYIYNKILSEIFYQSFSTYINESKINIIKDNIKYKTILLLFDLFQLFIDIIKNDDKINSKKGLINYDEIINIIIKEYIFTSSDNNSIDNEIKNKALFLLFSLTSNFYIEINDKNNTKIILNNVLNNSNSNKYIDPFLYYISFYLAINQKDINSLKLILQKINDLTKDIDIFNRNINDKINFYLKYKI